MSADISVSIPATFLPFINTSFGHFILVCILNLLNVFTSAAPAILVIKGALVGSKPGLSIIDRYIPSPFPE